MLLDLGLPDLDGIAVLKELRSFSKVPVIVLSARHESDDKVEALDLGADDYVTKPFALDELLARVRAALRHTDTGATINQGVVETGTLRLDVREARATRVSPTISRPSPASATASFPNGTGVMKKIEPG